MSLPPDLQKLVDEGDVPALAAALGDNDHHTNRHSEIAEALALTGDSRAVEPLIAALKLRHPTDRCEIARALGEIGDARAIPVLEEIASSEDDGTWDDGMYYGDGGAFIRIAQEALQAIKDCCG